MDQGVFIVFFRRGRPQEVFHPPGSPPDRDDISTSAGGNPDAKPYIIDCDASKARTRYQEDFSPCITRARWKGHWITNRRRRMTLEEMSRLQGFRPTEFYVNTSDQALGQQLGCTWPRGKNNT